VPSFANVHPTAAVHPGADLDPNGAVAAYALIAAQSPLGARPTISPHTVVTGRTTIGRDNRIFQFASIGEIPQDKKYANEDSALIIGDGNTIREFTTFNCGTAQDRNLTEVGNHNWIMAYVHIAHDCAIGDHVTFANGATLAGHVHVGDHATLGGFTLVHQFCRVGPHAFSGMGCALNRDLPPYVMAAGNPARLCGINREGLRRADFSPEVLEHLHHAYSVLLHRGTNARNEEIQTLSETCPEVRQLCDFMASSSRGVARA